MKIIRISWLRYLAFHTFHYDHQMTLNIKICVKVMKFLHNAYVALHLTYGLETTLKHGNWFQSNDYVSIALLYNYSVEDGRNQGETIYLFFSFTRRYMHKMHTRVGILNHLNSIFQFTNCTHTHALMNILIV